AALLRQTGDRLSEESCEFLPATCRRSCPTFPAARLQRQEIIQRSSNAWQFGVSNGYEMSCFGQALALSPKLLAFLWSNRAFQIRCALASRGQKRTRMRSEQRQAAAPASERARQHDGRCTLHCKIWQQYELREFRIGRNVV